MNWDSYLVIKVKVFGKKKKKTAEVVLKQVPDEAAIVSVSVNGLV